VRCSASQRLVGLVCLIAFGISHALCGGLILDCDHGSGVRHFEFACVEDDAGCDGACDCDSGEIDSQPQVDAGHCVDTPLVLDECGAPNAKVDLVAPTLVQLFVAPAFVDRRANARRVGPCRGRASAASSE
jgi:hypothetical protein